MPGGQGVRARTRDTFSKGPRDHGMPSLSTYLRVYKLGDLVDIKVNSAIHKGMPHKWYHGKTGVIWNVTKRAVGVEVNKKVGHRIMRKRIHVRIEHIKPSRCKEGFLKRRAENEKLKADANAKGERLPQSALKRKVVGPKPGFVLEDVKMETITAIPYDIIKEGLLS
eukprot:TRINITY_DN1137_c0_g2_i1.p2 TRINITY_DN1137_c0_g2~~TRINITY_DN1137_c0_g2_i1.p2  ORF type:complete len:167 (-),score=31.15 TRINITY_DN1137_c0_g2_i1:150-650(-)